MNQDKPILYEQKDVADAIVMRHRFMQKTFIPLNAQIESDSITI